jgi:hypothetical protein
MASASKRGGETGDVGVQWAARLSLRGRRIPIRMTLHVNFLLSVCRTVQRSEWDYADLIKHQRVSKGRNAGETVLVARLNSA